MANKVYINPETTIEWLNTGGDLDMDLGGEEPAAEEPAAEGDDVLLAEPGMKRDDKPVVYKDDDGMTTTRDSKHKMYRPVKPNQDKRKSHGPRSRQMTALGSHEMARAPSRQLRMNLPAGAKELLGLGKGIFENKTTNYEKEEKEMFEVKDDIKKIFEDLEQI